MKDTPPFDAWPARVRTQFEAWYAQFPGERALDEFARTQGMRPQTLYNASTRYGWAAEVKRRDAQLADETRARTLERHIKILDTAESAIFNSVHAFSLEATGVCSACRGSGKETVHGQTQTCERCKGRGKAYFDPARSREYREWFRLARELVLSVQGGGPSSLETGELSYAEVQRLNREMAERAGILSLAELEARAGQLHRK